MKLGVFVELQAAGEIERKARLAQEAGLEGIQVYPRGLALDEVELTHLAEVCAQQALKVPALSAYCDMLKPEAAPMGFTLERALRLVKWIGPLGAEGLVVWSGTLAADLLGAHAENRSRAAWERMRANASRLVERLEPFETALLTEPYYTHVAGDVEACLRLAEEVGSGRVKFVLDPPNLIPPEGFAQQRERMREMILALRSHIGLAHFKDARVRPDGEYDFPGPGEGDLLYPVYVGLLREIGYEGWGIIEHVEESRWKEAAQFVQGVLAESGWK